MKPDQFPLPGYKISLGLNPSDFSYQYFEPIEGSGASYSLKVSRATQDQPSAPCPTGSFSMTEVKVPLVGDAAKGCRLSFASDGVQLDYRTSARGVAVVVSTKVAPGQSETDVWAALSSLATYQLLVTDRADPPGPVLSPTTSPARFQFTAPLVLPAAEAGKPYAFSFCDPAPATRTTACGPFPATTNPTGGSPPYHFQYGTLGGFPPFGMALGKDGRLDGTAHSATAGKTYRFIVCAVDLKGDFVCREVSLTVGGATPAPVVQPPPAPVVKPPSEPPAPAPAPRVEKYDVRLSFSAKYHAETRNTYFGDSKISDRAISTIITIPATVYRNASGDISRIQGSGSGTFQYSCSYVNTQRDQPQYNFNRRASFTGTTTGITVSASPQAGGLRLSFEGPDSYSPTGQGCGDSDPKYFTRDVLFHLSTGTKMFGQSGMPPAAGFLEKHLFPLSGETVTIGGTFRTYAPYNSQNISIYEDKTEYSGTLQFVPGS